MSKHVAAESAPTHQTEYFEHAKFLGFGAAGHQDVPARHHVVVGDVEIGAVEEEIAPQKNQAARADIDDSGGAGRLAVRRVLNEIADKVDHQIDVDALFGKFIGDRSNRIAAQA